MYRPFLSYSLAIFIFGILLLFDFNYSSKLVTQPPISLQIDTQLYDIKLSNNQHQHESSKKIANNSKTNKHSKNHVESDEDINQKQQQIQKIKATNNINTNVKSIYQPLPEIPEDLRLEAMKTIAIARFYIDNNGLITNVELIQPCKSPKLNYLLIKNLKQWKFNASNESSIQDIKISFEVK